MLEVESPASVATSSPRRALVVGAWLAAFAAVVAALVQARVKPDPTGLLDLRIYLAAARAWTHGTSIYGVTDATFGLGSTYPPIVSVLLVPLAALPDRVAELVWTAANLAVLGAVSWWITTRYLKLPPARARLWVPLGFAAAVVTAPIWLTLNQGQVNLFVWALVLVDLEAAVRQRRWAGLGIGVAAAVKLVPALAIPVLLLAGRRAAALRASVTFAALSLVGLAAAPGDSVEYWGHRLWDPTHVGSPDDPANNSLLGLLARFGAGGPVRTVLWLAAVGLVLVVGVRGAARCLRAGDAVRTTLVVACAAALVSPIAWTHHLVALPLVIVLLLASDQLGPSPISPRPILAPRWVRAGAVAAVAVLLVDPLGWGANAATTTLRTLLLVGIVALCARPLVTTG